MNTQMIEQKINLLPKDLRKEALDFIEYLISKSKKSKEEKEVNFSWEGSLSDLKGKYSSVELQRKSMDWR